MSEQYLSRGKRLDIGILVTGYYFYSELKDKHYIMGDSIDYGEQKEEIDPATLGRCTGLKTKTGELVYEGDIVTSRFRGGVMVSVDNATFKIEFEEGCFAAYNNNGHRYFLWELIDTEIIGNIWDNPEMTEAEK